MVGEWGEGADVAVVGFGEVAGGEGAGGDEVEEVGVDVGADGFDEVDGE